jgi:hypothetical protein
MNEQNERSQEFNFICLEMADKMPFNVGRKLCLFYSQFLGLVFTKYPLTCMICFPNGSYGLHLRHGNNPDMIRDGIFQQQYVVGNAQQERFLCLTKLHI